METGKIRNGWQQKIMAEAVWRITWVENSDKEIVTEMQRRDSGK